MNCFLWQKKSCDLIHHVIISQYKIKNNSDIYISAVFSQIKSLVLLKSHIFITEMFVKVLLEVTYF